MLFENQIQTTSASSCRTQVQPATRFLVCSLIFIEYKYCPPRNIDLFRYKKGWKIIPSFFNFNNILQTKSCSHLLKMI